MRTNPDFAQWIILGTEVATLTLVMLGCAPGEEPQQADASVPSGVADEARADASVHPSDHEGDAGDGRFIDRGSDTPLAAPCTEASAPPAPLRRLTLREYQNTVQDLLGITSLNMEDFPTDPVSGGFDNNAAVHSVSPLLAEQYLQTAEEAARAAIETGVLVPCDPESIGDQACAEQFIAQFGRLAYRRPLEAAEAQRLLHVYAVGREESFEGGIALVIQAVLQAPAFLYRLELGEASDPNEVVPVTQYEVATRLSYLLWGSMPSAELLDAAAQGELDSPQKLAMRARTMLDDPLAPAQLSEFYVQWMGLRALQHLGKDPNLYPEFDDAIRGAMVQELPAFIEHVMRSGDGRLATLLTEPIGMVTRPLAALYGVDVPAGDTPALVEFDPIQRAGILTQAGVLAVHSLPNQSSPVARGKLIREKLLCQSPPAPPANVNINPPVVDPSKTTRERFAAHTESASCSGCHELMDPIGFAFESYDALGRYRQSEGGVSVDSSGWIAGSRDSDGPFEDVRELLERLANSRQVHDCVATQWFRFGFGRFESPGDACAIARVQEQFNDSQGDLNELLIALVQSDSFRFRQVPSLESRRP